LTRDRELLSVGAVSSAASLDEQLADLRGRLDQLAAERDKIAVERDEYRKLYLQMLELCKKLERGIVGPKREKLSPSDAQLAISLLETLLGEVERGTADEEPVATERIREHTRRKPTGRKPLPENLPRVEIEILPPEVQQKGLESFERIGEDVSETVERRPASLVVVRTRKPKFVDKERDRLAETKVFQAQSPELPIERGLAGPGFLADTIVRRWQDHLPLHRLEKIYAREGLEIARSTMCGWHAELAALAKPLIDAMWADAFEAPYLCSDATGVLVQNAERCRNGHFWVVVAPERHVLFRYTPKHNSDAVDRLLRGYKGYLVADAHAVFDHLYRGGDVIECGCWAHARRYWWKALSSEPERARKALAFIGGLFRVERAIATAPPQKREQIRNAESRPIVDAFFDWCDAEAPRVLDETPIAKAIGYARNQRTALERFLSDGRLPIHNNWSELQLRREVIGRRNWLFIGSDDAGEVNTTFVTLLASCQLHGIEPWAYLRDLFCLLPSWPHRRVLELAPTLWKKTAEDQDVQRRLAANIFRQATLDPTHQPTK
jgi:transposase